MKRLALIVILLTSFGLHAKTFKNSYVSFEVPDNWTCLQEGVAWTCTPKNPIEAKEAVIVLAAKVAGPEDNLNSFLTFLKKPKKIKTKIGTPMPSEVNYAQKRMLAGTNWVQAQHLGSEIQDYYTLYLATVKDQLAILISFSSEQSKVKTYNPIFDKAIKTLKIVANQQLLFPKSGKTKGHGAIGIQVPPTPINQADLLPPPPKKPRHSIKALIPLVLTLTALIGGALWIRNDRKRKKRRKIRLSKPK